MLSSTWTPGALSREARAYAGSCWRLVEAPASECGCRSASRQQPTASRDIIFTVNATILLLPGDGIGPEVVAGAATITANLAPGYSLSDAVDAVHAVEAQMAFPPQVRGQFIGKAAEFSASLTDEVLLLLAAVVVIYIVLGVLYESYIHPITIISTLPPAGVGALLALMVCGMSLSVDGIVGIVLLIGIVKKNAIMMIDFALDAQREGMSPHDAIRRACLLRFRPIMMTTAAALLGALPLALGNGIGSELRKPLGVSIVGGLLLSQLITLYTTPVIYLYFERLSDWAKERRAKRVALRERVA